MELSAADPAQMHPVFAAWPSAAAVLASEGGRARAYLIASLLVNAVQFYLIHGEPSVAAAPRPGEGNLNR